MTGSEQLMLELMNRARSDPVAEVRAIGLSLNGGLPPGTISARPKPPLAPSEALIRAARDHSRWMLATDTFSHTGVRGSTPFDRIRASGYVSGGSWTAGENIAFFSTSAARVDPVQAIREQHRGLLESPGHRSNLLNDAFREAGVGQAIGPFRSQGHRWQSSLVTQTFGSTGRTVYITGVVYRDRDGNHFYTPGEGLSGVGVRAANRSTVTFNSGGYRLAVPDGRYTVTFGGGGLTTTAQRTATVRGRNVKVDLVLPR